MALLTIQQQQAIKPISPNWASYIKFIGGKTNFEQLEIEVEEKEFKILLGLAFSQDIQNNPSTTDNLILLDGGTYTNLNNDLIYFKGLRYILAYMIYSSYIIESGISDTFTGMVKKNREEAESLSLGEKKILQQNVRQIALQEFEIIKDFLCLNKSKYPLWRLYQTKQVYTPKIYGIKRTIL